MIDRDKLYNRLNKDRNNHDYIPVIETTEDFYMILRNKVARCSRESYKRYDSYLESKDEDKKKSRFNKLSMSVELNSEENKGIWFDLKGFIEELNDEEIESINKSIEKYN